MNKILDKLEGMKASVNHTRFLTFYHMNNPLCCGQFH